MKWGYRMLGPLVQDTGHARPRIVGVTAATTMRCSATSLWPIDSITSCSGFGFKDEEPKAHAREKLFRPDKDAFLVRGYDADHFVVDSKARHRSMVVLNV